jgi:polyhydroxyalkanoate synthesis regulator phasin
MTSSKDSKKLVRTALLLGLGAASITADAVESAIEDLKEQGNLNENEARQLLKEVVAKQKSNAKAIAARELAMLKTRNPFVLKEEFSKLEQRVRKLETASKKGKR